MGSTISNGVHKETSAMDGPRVAGQLKSDNIATHHDHHVEGLNNGETNKPSAKLDIGIVGAGLAGLGTAIALRRKGYSVEIFERSRFSRETGAAIHICPNATRILTRWGFDFERAGAVVTRQTRILRGDTLEQKACVEYPDNIGSYGAQWYLFHRVDLHNELRRLAELPATEFGEGYGPPAKIRLDSEVTSETDIENGVICLNSGEKLQKDLIIAADGVHSLFVTKVTGAANPGITTNYSAFRFLIPNTTLLSNPLTSSLFSNSSGTVNHAALGVTRLVCYPCRADKIQNFVFIYPAHHQEREKEDWQGGSSGTRDDLLRLYPGAHPVVKEIFQLAPENEIKSYPLFFRAPLKTWHKHRCLLIGDAAHPMLPNQAQGGGMAFEDAEALAVVLTCMRNLELPELKRGLELFEKVRVQRASAMQIISSVPFDESPKVESQVRCYIGDKVPLGTLVDVRNWGFKYDVLDESEAALREYLEGVSEVP